MSMGQIKTFKGENKEVEYLEWKNGIHNQPDPKNEGSFFILCVDDEFIKSNQIIVNYRILSETPINYYL
jgi:hypothetical protein